MKPTFTPLFLLLSALAVPCQQEVASARSAAITATTTSAPTTFVLDAGSHEVTNLIDRVAAFLEYNILCEPGELSNAGSIRITRRTEVDTHGCWKLFNSLLYHKGLAIVPLQADQGFYQVLSMQGHRSREISSAAMFVPHQEVEAYAGSMATAIQTTVPLQNVNATIATNALRPFFASTGSPQGGGLTLGNVGNNTSLLLQGYGHQVAAACRLLERVDVSDTERSKLQVVVLEHAAAQELASRLEETFNARSQQAHMQAQQQGGIPVATPLRVVAHPSLNALILAGLPVQIDEALQLIAVLDRPAAHAPAMVEQMQKRIEKLEARLNKLEQAMRAEKSGK